MNKRYKILIALTVAGIAVYLLKKQRDKSMEKPSII
jgi:hypothetical protein